MALVLFWGCSVPRRVESPERGATIAPAQNSSASAAASPTHEKLAGKEGGGDSKSFQPMSKGATGCAAPEDTKFDAGVVIIRVLVSREGKALEVDVLEASPPDVGFEAIARACAMSRTYPTALDSDGAPIEGWSPVFRVRFERRFDAPKQR